MIIFEFGSGHVPLWDILDMREPLGHFSDYKFFVLLPRKARIGTPAVTHIEGARLKEEVNNNKYRFFITREAYEKLK